LTSCTVAEKEPAPVGFALRVPRLEIESHGGAEMRDHAYVPPSLAVRVWVKGAFGLGFGDGKATVAGLTVTCADARTVKNRPVRTGFARLI
jgi:hypothetical protein